MLQLMIGKINKGRKVPQSMDTVNDLRQVFLLVQVGQFEYKTLNSLEI